MEPVWNKLLTSCLQPRVINFVTSVLQHICILRVVIIVTSELGTTWDKQCQHNLLTDLLQVVKVLRLYVDIYHV